MTKKNNVTLTDNSTGKSYEYPLLSGSTGPRVIDIRNLYSDTGLFTYDPGFTSTASCESSITYIDGNAGILRYRGYNIEDLTEHSDYMDTCYLLLNGDLPNKIERDKFVSKITRHSLLHEQILFFFRGFRRDAHPMAIMVGVVGAMSSFYHDSTDIGDPHQRMVASFRLLAKMPTIAAYAYKYSLGQAFMYPKNDLDYASNFLRMMFGNPCEEYEVNPVIRKAMDKIFILHADHEQNASTSTVRISGSSGANPFACIAAGISSLWGPAHGGANEAVLTMLQEIGTVSNIDKFVARAKNKDDPFRLMGFGHRVYKNYDPRAQVLRQSCHDILNVLKIDDPLFEVAMALENLALNDEYFIERKLFPNVDFYSGIILKAIGIPVSMFTVLFAMSRTVGWVAQWTEMLEDSHQKIGRPRQLFKGVVEREYVPLSER